MESTTLSPTEIAKLNEIRDLCLRLQSDPHRRGLYVRAEALADAAFGLLRELSIWDGEPIDQADIINDHAHRGAGVAEVELVFDTAGLQVPQLLGIHIETFDGRVLYHTPGNIVHRAADADSVTVAAVYVERER